MRLAIIIFALLLAACSSNEGTKQVQEKVVSATKATAKKHKDPKEIVLVTYAGPTTYYINADNQYSGIEYDLATLFTDKYADEYKIKFKVVNKISEVLPALLSGEADIAAANLTITPSRQKKVSFATPYHQTQQRLVFNRDSIDPTELSFENKKLVVRH